MSMADINIHLTADTSAFTNAMNDATAQTLAVETAIPAETWREAMNLAGDRALFNQALEIWRNNYSTTGEDPRTIVATLKDLLAR